ncbi:DUF86 domain-containing protein [bacterium]|nr:DUF86 domain-containing protein [bacterium]
MKDDKLILQQMLQFIERIEQYVSGMSFDEFSKDYKSQDAIIRNVEIIGEAANRLNKKFLSDNKDFPIAEAVSMRNKLIHGYDDVDLEIVWTTAITDIQTLKTAILRII